MTVPQLPGARVRERRGGAAWQVRVDRLLTARQLVVTSVGCASLSEVELNVARWRPPVSGWLGRPGLAGIRNLSIKQSDKGVEVLIETTAPVDAGLLLAAAVRCLQPVPTGEVGPMLTFAPGLPPAAASLACDVRDVQVDGEVRDAHVRRSDVVVVPDGRVDPLPETASVVVVTDGLWTRDGHAFEICVDPVVHRPIGRRSIAAEAVATAVADGDVVTITTDGATVTVDGAVSPADVSALRRTRAIIGDGLPPTIVRQLSASGIVVAGPGQPLPAADDHLSWQAWSVHERRHALRMHGPAVALDAWPTVSVVLVTNRPDHLDHALEQVAALRYPHLEVVIGAHGDQVDAARIWDRALDVPHPVTVVGVDDQRTLGEALQSCSDRAEGTLVTKMDDDDYYGPEHVWDLVLARQYSGAQVVGKALDWVHLETDDVTVFRPAYAAEKYAGFVAGGTILISRADLGAVGGWRPVPRSVDRALLDRVLADGGLVYRTHGLGYVYVRHSAGHTASVRDEHFLTKVTDTYPGLIAHDCFGTAAGRATGAF